MLSNETVEKWLAELRETPYPKEFRNEMEQIGPPWDGSKWNWRGGRNWFADSIESQRVILLFAAALGHQPFEEKQRCQIKALIVDLVFPGFIDMPDARPIDWSQVTIPGRIPGDGNPLIWLAEAAAQSMDLPILGAKASAVYELLLALPEYRGMTGREIVDALPADASMDESTFRKSIVPALEPYGIENAPKVGYRIKPSQRPKPKQSA